MSQFPKKSEFKRYITRKRRERISSIKDIMDSSTDPENFLAQVQHISPRDIFKIEKLSIGQFRNELWMHFRKHTITASIAHRVRNAQKKADDIFRVRALIAKERHVPKYIPALLYGQESEEKAIGSYLEKYRKDHNDLICVSMGLKLYEDIPFLGASPDGILCCRCHTEKYLVEVKCPYSLKCNSILQNGHKLPYLTSDLKLKKTHSHWTQIQVGMGVCKLNKAKFLVCSKVDLLEIEVKFDAEFFEGLITDLREYYTTKYLPYIRW